MDRLDSSVGAASVKDSYVLLVSGGWSWEEEGVWGQWVWTSTRCCVDGLDSSVGAANVMDSYVLLVSTGVDLSDLVHRCLWLVLKLLLLGRHIS